MARLRTLHVSPARCAELLQSNPRLMLSTLKSSIDFLLDYGLSRSDLKKWAYIRPDALGQSTHAMGTILLQLHNLNLERALVS